MRVMRMPHTIRETARLVTVICALLGGIAPATAQIPSWGVDEFTHRPTPDGVRSRGPISKRHISCCATTPGGAAQLHDIAFQERLDSAHAVCARARPHDESYQGYTAVLAGFATGMGDKHIWRPSDASGQSPALGRNHSQQARQCLDCQ